MAEKNVGPRIPDIDLLRTLAIGGMIVYHGVYDLAVFFDAPIDPFDGGWKLLARATAILFLVVSGISGSLAIERSYRVRGTSAMWKRSSLRALRIGAAALLVTVVTYFFAPDDYVRFGILHCIAVSALLLPLLRPLGGIWAIVPGILMIVAGSWVHGILVDTPLLLPLGLRSWGFSSMDYFPILPWGGWVCIGYAMGKVMMPFWERRVPPRESWQLRALSFPGKHSLAIYLLHQPILLAFFSTVQLLNSEF